MPRDEEQRPFRAALGVTVKHLSVMPLEEVDRERAAGRQFPEPLQLWADFLGSGPAMGIQPSPSSATRRSVAELSAPPM